MGIKCLLEDVLSWNKITTVTSDFSTHMCEVQRFQHNRVTILNHIAIPDQKQDSMQLVSLSLFEWRSGHVSHLLLLACLPSRWSSVFLLL